jgi:hypothetical protein
MPTISRRHLVAAFALLAVVPRARAAAPTTPEVWKMRGCPCCAGWAKHFEAAGFATKVQEVDDVVAFATDGNRSVFMEVRP